MMWFLIQIWKLLRFIHKLFYYQGIQMPKSTRKRELKQTSIQDFVKKSKPNTKVKEQNGDKTTNTPTKGAVTKQKISETKISPVQRLSRSVTQSQQKSPKGKKSQQSNDGKQEASTSSAPCINPEDFMEDVVLLENPVGTVSNETSFNSSDDAILIAAAIEAEAEANMNAESPIFLEDDGGYSQENMSAGAKKNVSKGQPISKLRSYINVTGKLTPSKNHILLIHPHIDPKKSPKPYPDTYRDKWDNYHVRMPCSKKNLYPLTTNKSKPELKQRWEMIEKALKQRISSSYDLEEIILSYNERLKDYWNFESLHQLWLEELSSSYIETLQDTVIPGIVKLALALPHLVTGPIPLLQQRTSLSITLSQLQIASLLANAFLCTFPRRNTKGATSEFANYPSINFNSLFAKAREYRSGRNKQGCKMEKIKCILRYFSRVCNPSSPPLGTVTFTRRCLAKKDGGPGPPEWAQSKCTFDFSFHVTSTGSIEEGGAQMLQADFANKYVGGGVLGNGCVQEEIRFVICPELLVSRLFTEYLLDDEALLIEGAEQFVTYSGYSDGFKCESDFNEGKDGHGNKRDDWGRWNTSIVAIDASVFNKYWDQFQVAPLLRELNKAYCGFADTPYPARFLPPTIATGNWGCGAFRGDHKLKALLQMMVCAEAGKNLAYFTFGDVELCEDIMKMYQFLKDQSVTVGQLFRAIIRYGAKGAKTKYRSKIDLYNFLVQSLTNDSESSNSSSESDRGQEEEKVGIEENVEQKTCDTEPYSAEVTADDINTPMEVEQNHDDVVEQNAINMDTEETQP